MFQATTRGWRRIAARLLLVPALAGGAAVVASAQPPRPGQQMPAAGGDPKAMLKEGRKALSEGRFNDARDLAQRAEASNPTGKWGLFDDTPNALRRDVESGQVKAKDAEIENLTKQAKALTTRAASSDAEKARNLDQALQLARRADQLHGPNYSVWEIGGRPDRLVKDLEAARAKLGPATPPATPVAGASKSNPAPPPLPPATRPACRSRRVTRPRRSPRPSARRRPARRPA
ncbi:hypothetical protein J0H58_01250 [bacterium]|nr:hypothetical protein [bacterium]